MSHRLGVYFCPSHDRPGDWDYIRNLNPPVVRILMPGDAPTNLVSRVHQAAPNARISLRWWDVDDGGEGNKRGKLNSPEASASNDAKTYFSRIQQMEFDAEESGLPFPPRNKLLVNALNEAPTWEHDKRAAIVAYNRTLILAMVRHGIPVAALCLAVGHPEEWPPKWDWAQPVIDAIRMSPGSVLELHSYWQLAGPNHIWTDAQGNQRKDWGALAGRYLHCPYDVPILIGECAADGRIYDRKPQHTGWRGNIPAAEYAAQLRFYLEAIHQDSRIIAALPFLTDTPDMESWGSFDTEQAHGDILAMARSLPPVGTPTPPPQPIPVGSAYVLATAGANIRAAPLTGDVLIAVPWRKKVDVLGYDSASRWFRVRWQWVAGWMSPDLLGVERPEPVVPAPVVPAPVAPPPVAPPPVPPVPPVPVGDKWQRSIAFVRRWEGGWADDPNDPGGATNKGITIGTYTRWRAEHGQPVPTKEDLRAITDEEADRIFFEWYWLASASDKLPFPLCLAQMDTAVNAGVGKAQEMLGKSGGNFLLYVAEVLDWYTRIANFEHFGRAWTRRRADLLREAAK